MKLLQNPFYILSASPRDGRHRLMELAEECSLLTDLEEVNNARSCLTNPRTRITAECTWLTGISPHKVDDILVVLKNNPEKTINYIIDSPLARANVLADAIMHLPHYLGDGVALWLEELCSEFEKITISSVTSIINADRIVSGFPEILDHSYIEAELCKQQEYFVKALKYALDQLYPRDLIQTLTKAASKVTKGGTKVSPVLMVALIDSYEIEVQTLLEQERQKVSSAIKNIQNALQADHSDELIRSQVQTLKSILTNWDFIAQPIQLCTQSRGLEHELSKSIAIEVRSLAIDMYNNHGKLHFAQEITALLSELFVEVDSVAERLGQDEEALQEVEANQAFAQEALVEELEKIREKTTFRAQVGAIFKDPLEISLDGIFWKNRHWDLNNISSIRWGGTRHSVNGIPTGTTYTIAFGSSHNLTTIELRSEKTFIGFSNSLMQLVGLRLIKELLEKLKGGGSSYFGPVKITDTGASMPRKGFFSGPELIYSDWNDLDVWEDAGCLCLRKKTDRKVQASLSYLDVDNAHVLSFVLLFAKQRRLDRLSESI